MTTHVIDTSFIPKDAEPREREEIKRRQKEILEAFNEYQLRIRRLIFFVAEIEERITNGRLD